MYRKALALREVALAASSRARINSYWALAANLQSRGIAPAEVRWRYRQAQSGALERMRSFTGFTASARNELVRYGPIFTGQVRAAWDLTSPAR
jgi:hypothetical protein